ncbi:hypothetical protein GmHk_04G010298 [Glycine max]|nr:hypothetical protein GmHk_04G010298 [Glycine max]
MFSGYGVRKEKVNISLLQYVEDTIFFGMPTLSNALIIKSIMKCYELVSRLKVNFIKSRYVSVGIPNSMVERFIGLLNCKILVINFVHLGISIGENLRKDSTWRPVVEKILPSVVGEEDYKVYKGALLAKWRWALFHSKGALWEKFFRSKYGGWIGLLEEFPNSLMSIWWKDLRSIYGDEEESKWFDNMIQWKDSEGNITRFWFDAWLQGQSLVTIYGRIFSNSTQKDDCIGNIGSCEDVVCIW